MFSPISYLLSEEEEEEDMESDQVPAACGGSVSDVASISRWSFTMMRSTCCFHELKRSVSDLPYKSSWNWTISLMASY